MFRHALRSGEAHRVAAQQALDQTDALTLNELITAEAVVEHYTNNAGT